MFIAKWLLVYVIVALALFFLSSNAVGNLANSRSGIKFCGKPHRYFAIDERLAVSIFWPLGIVFLPFALLLMHYSNHQKINK